MRLLAAGVLVVSLLQMRAQATAAPTPADVFEVATVKPAGPDEQPGRSLNMQGPHRFVARNFTLKLLIAAAYDLNSRTISGGPAWLESEHFNIEAITPGEVRPDRMQQMKMLRSLLADRFQLRFHREEKEFSLYELTVAKGGPKLKTSAPSDQSPALASTVYPQKIVMPARNATMDDFVAVLQRALLDRPVVNKTGLQGRYDFELEWAPDETQFGGEVPVARADAPSLPLFAAMQQQLGLKIEAKRGMISALVVDSAAKPMAD
jgi:uncharacterized protein (TIGR03435 family)